MDALTAHFDPLLSEVYSRTLFQSRDQLPGRSALGKLVRDCNFGTPDSTIRLYENSTMLPLDVMMRCRFVCGLRDVHIQQRLFAEQDLPCKRHTTSLSVRWVRSSSNDA